MVKLILRPLMLLVIVFGLGGYVFYLGTGSFPMFGSSISSSSSKEKRPDLRRLSTMPALNSIEQDEAADDSIYRWQDENGVWHISNLPPAGKQGGMDQGLVDQD